MLVKDCCFCRNYNVS